MLESLPSCIMNAAPVFRTFWKALALPPSRFVYLPSEMLIVLPSLAVKGSEG